MNLHWAHIPEGTFSHRLNYVVSAWILQPENATVEMELLILAPNLEMEYGIPGQSVVKCFDVIDHLHQDKDRSFGCT